MERMSGVESHHRWTHVAKGPEVHDKYRVGPIADRQWWRSKRAQVTDDHGLCEIPLYIVDMEII